ncbi:DEAD-box ATP-dependent RNA helicase 5 isoform X2 [Nicotiana tabacum]|uniref:DEAD-box ATP-dependent RNA helicase 5 isoform X2 n=1 Tax=Nicotiana tabacum TaxID=4097 RepID=A0AC58UG53_TOBAC
MVAKQLADDEPQKTLKDSPKFESKSHKKKHKRKLEDPEPEEVTVIESKKEKKKKKKQKQNQEQEGSIVNSENLSGSNGKVETINGSAEFSEKSSTNVVVTGKDANESKYKALAKFVDSGLPSDVLDCCKNFEKPSPIQSHSWPFLLDGRDFIGIAKTGSGKTLAFGIPAIMHVLSKRKSKKSKNPLCLVLSPTRELAQQISDVLCDAGKPTGVQSVCLYGGVDKHHQKASLKSGVDIVIGTPGRLQDMMEMGACNLKAVSFVVLDEADRMLDLGFEPAVRAILSQTCSVRQSVMFSATWPPAVHQLAQEFMDPHPIKVVVGSEDLAANHDVMQIVEVLEDRARDERLQCLLEKYHKFRKNRVLVFVLYKKEASRVEIMLQKRGWKVVSISGDKQQHARTKALSLFKDGSCPLMIATDVAARGLDIPDVEVVINYSFPLTTEDYVHRIGRTGRAGKKGVAHTFFTKDNKGLSGELINVLREAGQVVPAALLNFGTHVKKKESKLYGAHFREIDANAPKATKIKFDNSDEED